MNKHNIIDEINEIKDVLKNIDLDIVKHLMDTEFKEDKDKLVDLYAIEMIKFDDDTNKMVLELLKDIGIEIRVS